MAFVLYYDYFVSKRGCGSAFRGSFGEKWPLKYTLRTTPFAEGRGRTTRRFPGFWAQKKRLRREVRKV